MNHFYLENLLRYSRDWVDPSQCRDPDQYPYSFDAYFIWRGDVTGSDVIYSDRMFEWDREKAKKAFEGFGWYQEPWKPKKKCQKVIDLYYDRKYKCVGYAVCCNVSNGYPIGMFYIKEKGNTA